jgi:hypothetical protein
VVFASILALALGFDAVPANTETAAERPAGVPTSPVVISGTSGQTVRTAKIMTTSGPCITIKNATNVEISNSDIGPCGGNAVEIMGSSAIKVVNNHIHTERSGATSSNSGLGLFIHKSRDVLVQGNEFRYNESSLYATSSAVVQVIGNFSLNPLGPVPRGQHVQFNNVHGGLISENYFLSIAERATVTFTAHQEDAINLWNSAFVRVQGNYLVGGTSPSGCGIIADGSGNANILLANVVIRTAQCGIGIAGGTNHVIQDNKVLDTNIPHGMGNVGIYVWNQYAGPCSGHSIIRNYVSNRWPNGYHADYWNAGNCGAVSLRENIWGQSARELLTPESKRLPRPPIPPKPYVP